MPDTSRETFLEKAKRYENSINNLENSFAMNRNLEGKQIVAGLMESEVNDLRKELRQQLPDFIHKKNEEADNILQKMKTSKDNQEYRELAEKRLGILDKIKETKTLMDTLDNCQVRLQNVKCKNGSGYTIITPNGKGVFDSYQGVITAQGTAYPDKVINDCGVCSMVNLANQQGASFTEKSGLAIGYGNYSHGSTAKDSGWTYLYEQSNILSALGFRGRMEVTGLTFEALTKEIIDGHSVSINLSDADLRSGDQIAKRSKENYVGSKLKSVSANHAVTVTGVVRDQFGNFEGILINDTGGNGGRDKPIIYISKTKYENMRMYTDGFSSIVCTGRRN